MNDKKLFSQYHSTDLSKYEDKEKFRHRLLKYLEDFVNLNFPQTIYLKCRSQMGLDIEKTPMPNIRRPDREHYAVEKLFAKRSVSDILDFVGVCYFALAPSQNNNPNIAVSLKRYLEEINTIFREESMCYEMHNDGRVRYYPDDEFQQAVSCTLTVLSKPKYRPYLISFNQVLDDLYKNYSTEAPLNKLFKVIETLALSILNDKKHNRLYSQSVNDLTVLLKERSKQDINFTNNDRDALTNFNITFSEWINTCHKYRHGKAEQQTSNIPRPLFTTIFSIGIAFLRFLLELDDEWNLISAILSEEKN